MGISRSHLSFGTATNSIIASFALRAFENDISFRRRLRRSSIVIDVIFVGIFGGIWRIRVRMSKIYVGLVLSLCDAFFVESVSL